MLEHGTEARHKTVDYHRTSGTKECLAYVKKTWAGEVHIYPAIPGYFNAGVYTVDKKRGLLDFSHEKLRNRLHPVSLIPGLWFISNWALIINL